MSSWKEIAISGSSPELKSLHLSGTNDGTEYSINGLYQPNDELLHLAYFTSVPDIDNNAWQTNENNLNDNLTPWVSKVRSVTSPEGVLTTHQGFDRSGLSHLCLPITITDTSANPGQVGLQSNTAILIDDVQNGVDYADYFNALDAATSGWGTYTLTDGTFTASYEIGTVEGFSAGNTRITGNPTENDGVQLQSLSIGNGEICLPPASTTGSNMIEPLTTGTGPTSGINPGQTTAKNRNQTSPFKFLYAETSDPGEHTYSIASPFINLHDYIEKKLVFFFHLHGANCGTFKVYTSPSSESLVNASVRAMRYSSWPGANGAFPNSAESNNYWSGGSVNFSDIAYSVGPGEVQEAATSPFNRVEVDLTSFTSGYIWIVYESGNPGIDLGDSPADAPKADFAIGSLYLDLQGYTQPEYFALVAETPTLEVKFDHVRFVNLPTSDPEVLGALYKDPSNLTGIRSQIRISNGLP